MDKLRQQITFEAARLMFQRQESEYGRARVRAARLVCRQRLRPSELPTNREIREELQRLTSSYTIPVPHDESPDQVSSAPGRRKNDSPVTDNYLRPSRTSNGIAALIRKETCSITVCKSFAWPAKNSLTTRNSWRPPCCMTSAWQSTRTIPVAAGLNALGDSISERTAWLIENLAMAHDHLGRTIGIRARRRLQNSESGDELILLAKCDDAGRVPGADAPDLEDALAYLRELAESNE